MDVKDINSTVPNKDIYISLDHLKNGKYTVKLLLGNKVLKAIKIKKT